MQALPLRLAPQQDLRAAQGNDTCGHVDYGCMMVLR